MLVDSCTVVGTMQYLWVSWSPSSSYCPWKKLVEVGAPVSIPYCLWLCPLGTPGLWEPLCSFPWHSGSGSRVSAPPEVDPHLGFHIPEMVKALDRGKVPGLAGQQTGHLVASPWDFPRRLPPLPHLCMTAVDESRIPKAANETDARSLHWNKINA